MAKQEKKTGNADQTVSSYPDPKKNTIVLRYPLDGSVKVVSDLKIENNIPKITTVDPITKNHPSFYHVTNSRFVAQVFSTLRIQAVDNKNNPELYLCPFNKVGELGAELIKLQANPKDEDALAIGKAYRTSTSSLDRIIFDKARMPIAELAAAGFDVETMEKDGAFEDLQYGKDTKLYERNRKGGDRIQEEGVFSIQAVANEYGEISFKAVTPLAIPEFLTNAELRKQITNEDIDQLRQNRTLNHLIQHDGKWCYAGFNRNTGRMKYVDQKDVIVPDFIYNVRVKSSQQDDLARGGRAYLEGCTYSGSDNSFSGLVQFDVATMNFVISEPHYEKPYISKNILDQMTPEMHKAFLAGEELDGRKFKSKNGIQFTNNIRLNPDTNAMEFVRYKRPEESQEQAKKQDQAAVAVPEPETSEAPSIFTEAPAFESQKPRGVAR